MYQNQKSLHQVLIIQLIIFIVDGKSIVSIASGQSFTIALNEDGWVSTNMKNQVFSEDFCGKRVKYYQKKSLQKTFFLYYWENVLQMSVLVPQMIIGHEGPLLLQGHTIIVTSYYYTNRFFIRAQFMIFRFEFKISL